MGHLVHEFESLLEWHPYLTYNKLLSFEEAIADSGGCSQIWGFVDGTFQGFCRPAGDSEV
jgi:hypothetical protein